MAYHLECIPEYWSATKYLKTCKLHCSPVYQSVSRCIAACHLKYKPVNIGQRQSILRNIPDDRLLHCISRITDWYTGEQCSWQVFVYFSADRYSGTSIHFKCLPQVTDWYIGVQLSWQDFIYIVADWYLDVHFMWQASIPWVTDWYPG